MKSKLQIKITPSPLAGEGEGKGGNSMITPTLVLPHQGGG